MGEVRWLRGREQLAAVKRRSYTSGLSFPPESSVPSSPSELRSGSLNYQVRMARFAIHPMLIFPRGKWLYRAGGIQGVETSGSSHPLKLRLLWSGFEVLDITNQDRNLNLFCGQGDPTSPRSWADRSTLGWHCWVYHKRGFAGTALWLLQASQ